MNRWTGVVIAALAACAGDPPQLCPGVLPAETVFADEGPDPLVNDLAVDAERVFWVTFGSNEVRQVAKGGGSAETIAESIAPRRIALDEQNVYWVSGAGGVSSVSKTGGPVTVISPDLECSVAYPCGDAIAVDADAVYWAADSQLLSWSKVDQQPVALNAPGLYTGDIILDATNVYWGALILNGEQLSFELRASPKSGGESQTIGTLAEETYWVPYAMAGDADNIYVARLDGIWKFPKDGSGPVQVAVGPILPQSIATDGVDVYVAESARIERTPTSGGELDPIACEQMEAVRLAIDETSVYWNAVGTNAIFSVPK